ncbi:hypothetical protein ACMBCN_02440 [Candidatus Liberibacter asiaticus]|nr:hypothetical protein [Candidatus Liberibacter asiaticus]
MKIKLLRKETSFKPFVVFRFRFLVVIRIFLFLLSSLKCMLNWICI